MRAAALLLALGGCAWAQTVVVNPPAPPLSAASLTGQVAIANGGTGAVTAAAGLAALGGASLTAANTFTSAGTQTFGGPLLAPAGAVGTPSFSFSTDTTTGFYRAASGDIRASSAGVDTIRLVGGKAILPNTGALAFGSSGVGSADVGFSRLNPGVIGLGQGVVGDISGTLAASRIGLSTSSPTTALTVNGSITTIALATPGAPTVVNVGAAGSTTYSYLIVAKQADGSFTAGGTVGTTATGNATLDAVSNWNSLSWTAVTNAANYDVYRTVGGATQGKIATGVTAAAYLDQGGAGSGSVPTSGTTGGAVIPGPITAGTMASRGIVQGAAFTAAQGFSLNYYNYGLQLGPSSPITWGATTVASGWDAGITRNAAGLVEINNGTSGTIRDLQIRALNPSSGNVLIGTTTDTTSGARLQVAGNGVQLVGAAQPTCDAAHAGLINYSGHSAGVKDTVAVCGADATNAYAWRTIY